MLQIAIAANGTSRAPGTRRQFPACQWMHALKNRLINGCQLALSVLLFQAWTMMVPLRAAETKPADKKGFAGKVIETMDSGGYTYVQVDTGKEKVWAAGPQLKVKVGDQVSFGEGFLMRNHQSKTLNRTFENIYFVGSINLPGQESSSQNPHGTFGGADPHALMKANTGVNAAAVTNFSGLKKPAGGLTVAEVFAQKNTLTAKQVTLRGKVVKYTAQIMGKNWLHLQDGTGVAGSNDLIVITTDTAHLGDTVLVIGTVALNKDLGFNYKYDLLVEEAKVTVESKANP